LTKSSEQGLTAGVKNPNPMSSASSILTVGSMAFDTIRTPTGVAESVLGGSVNYFSIAASFFAPVQVVGVVGEDFPSTHLDWLASRQIDVSGIEVALGKTFHWTGSYDGNMNEAKTHSTALNVFESFNPQLQTKHRDSSYLFLANIDPVLQQRVLDQKGTSNLIACDSMNFWITGKLEEVRKTLKRIDVLCINEGESVLLSGQRNLMAAATAIRSMGPSVLIIKRGEYGASLFTDQGIFFAPAFPTQTVVDPTGAGDSFAGAFMGYLAKVGAHRDMAKTEPEKWNAHLRRAVIAGCVMASFTVEDFSVHRLMRLTPEELSSRMDHLLKMMLV